MPGLNAGLNIGLSGLHASQSAMDVIGHNIANINTPGFSRQQVELATAQPQSFGQMQYGSGVDVTRIIGVRDKFLDMQITQSLGSQSGSDARYKGIQAIASAFQEDGSTGLNTQVQQFFSSLQQLAARPEDGALRNNLVGMAETMVNAFKSRYKMLTDQVKACDNQVGSMVSEVNSLTKQIAKLNDRIATEPTPGSDSDARDQRKALADRLGKLVGIQVFEDEKSRMQITLDTGAAVLVSGNLAAVMTANVDTAHYGGKLRVEVGLEGPDSHPIDVTKGIRGGDLGGNLDLRDNILPGYQARMDQLAASLSGQVNLVHRQGYALDGKTTGIDFFKGGPLKNPQPNNEKGLPAAIGGPPDYTGMVNCLSVNAAVAADPSLIAAALVPGAAGDNKNAIALAQIETTTGQFSAGVSSLANSAGTQAEGFKADAANQENLTGALQTQRNRTSAVDLDEEAAQLLSFQRGYQAAARFINVISQLTDQLVNGLGK
jgi:flagellar hook-associated protein 1 FlgK